VIEGGCRCGACRYTLAVDATPPVYCCHCQICQTTSGSAFSEQAVVPEAAISASGPVIDYLYTTVSGARSHHRICGACHTRLWNTNALRPGIALVRAGTLDDAEHIAPRAHIWVRRKQPWIVIPDGIPQWPESAPLAELTTVLMQ
jgi:hypothetical protein